MMVNCENCATILEEEGEKFQGSRVYLSTSRQLRVGFWKDMNLSKNQKSELV